MIALFSFSAYDVRIFHSRERGEGEGEGKERGRERRGGGGRRGGVREGEWGGREGEYEWGGREGGIFNLSLSLGHSKAGSTFFHYVL